MAIAEKTKITYEEKIISVNETFENPFNMEDIPVFSIDNCEVLFSSLTAKTPQYGHNIQILLPSETDFPKVDRTMRNNFLVEAQKDNENLEFVKGSLTAITQKHVLDKKFSEKHLGRTYINFNMSNSVMFDRTVDENGKTVEKRISKASDATGEAVVKYFRVVDEFSGEGINPEVFKYVNGDKVTTFTNPKTKQESPLYVGSGDVVNIKIRPYGVKNKKTGEISLRYNLLSLEIVQTAWDRGMGRKSGSKQVHEAPEAIGASSLSAIFGGLSSAIAQPKPVEKKPQPVATSTPKAEQPKAEQPKAEQPAQEVPALDFSALSNMSLDNINLGD